jgi:hypothetical protein
MRPIGKHSVSILKITKRGLAARLRDLLRLKLMPLRYLYLTKIRKYNIQPTTMVSYRAFLDKTAPHLVTIGERTIVTSGATILTHDFTRAMSRPPS